MRRPRRRGFTLVELAVVLLVMAIALVIGVPAFVDLIRSQQIASASNDFMVSINLARTEAMQRGERVDLMPTDGSDWAHGWTTFIDVNGNRKPDDGEKILFSHGPVTDRLRIVSSLTDSSTIYLAYDPSGRSRTNSSSHSPQSGTISFILGKQIRRIKINFLGRPRVCNPVNDNTCTGSFDAK